MTASRHKEPGPREPFLAELRQGERPDTGYDLGTGNGVENYDGERQSRRLMRKLCISHALTTWNARSYEFAAILFTAASFPGTLLWSSVRGMVTTLATLALSSLLGRTIDRSSNRLRPLLLSVSVNRASVILACLAWPLLLDSSPTTLLPGDDSLGKLTLFAVVVVLGVLERLSGVANMLSSERDWAPAIAMGMSELPLTRLNAILRRIDLICKLVSPLIISAVATVFSMPAAVWMLCGLNAVSWAVEMWAARSVWRECPPLQEPRERWPSGTTQLENSPTGDLKQSAWVWLKTYLDPLRSYFSSGVCAPSLALALLHFSALSYSATLITYLLSVGFSLTVITIARAVGSVVEVSSTFVAPAGIRRLTVESGGLSSDAYIAHDGQTDVDSLAQEPRGHGTGLARCGLWGLFMQSGSLVPVVLAVWAIAMGAGAPRERGVVLAVTFFSFLSVSRLGLWVFDLTVQELTQSRVPVSQRSSFGGTEASFVALFELLQWASAALVSDPKHFQYLATASFTAVVMSTILYASWVWRQRGHLIHWEKIPRGCNECCKKEMHGTD